MNLIQYNRARKLFQKILGLCLGSLHMACDIHNHNAREILIVIQAFWFTFYREKCVKIHNTDPTGLKSDPHCTWWLRVC